MHKPPGKPSGREITKSGAHVPPTGKLGAARKWTKPLPVADWSTYQLRSSDIVLLKELELAGSVAALRQRLAEADAEDLEHLVQLAQKGRGEVPLVQQLRQLLNEKMGRAPVPQRRTPSVTQPGPQLHRPQAMGDESSKTITSADAIRRNLESHITPLVARGQALLGRIKNDQQARIFCEGFVDACLANDPQGVTEALVEAGFAERDRSHLLEFGKDLGSLRLDDGGLGQNEAFARGVGHAITPLDSSCAPASLAKTLGPRARQAYIYGVVTAQELGTPTKKRLAMHLVQVIDLLRAALGTTGS